MLITMEPILMWIHSSYFVDGNQNPFSVDHLWSSIIPTPYSCCFLQLLCVYAHCNFYEHCVWAWILVPCKWIHLSKSPKIYIMLCCVITTFNFGSIKFCNLCFALELLLKLWVVGYCYSFWFAFIVFLGNLNPNEACVPKMWKEMFCLWRKWRKKFQEASKEKAPPTSNDHVSLFLYCCH